MAEYTAEEFLRDKEYLVQPKPLPNNNPHIADLVIEDIYERKQLGLNRYGVPLQAHNGRDGLRDLYEELGDALQYVRQLMYERDGH
jgi:hypothetical protein